MKQKSRNIISQLFSQELDSLEKCLLYIKEDKVIYANFNQWKKTYSKVYNEKDLDYKLFISSAIIYYMGNLFLYKYVLKENNYLNDDKEGHLDLLKINGMINNRFQNLELFHYSYFEPFIKNKILNESFTKSLIKISKHIFNLQIEPEFMFDYLIQNILSPLIRHGSGEFYTPPFLVKKMVVETYKIGEKTLDPCCGTGNFLIEILKTIINSDKSKKEKLEAIDNIYGYDINPLSILMLKITFLYLTKDLNSKLKLNLFTVNSLFNHPHIPKNKFDLIIGNPPWYTYRDVEIPNYQERIKNLAEELDIKPLPKNILNIEISSLFFFQAKNLYMNENAKIFFVITKGVITGSHASQFRNFKGFNNVKIWSFDKKIEQIFNIDFICLFAEKSENITEHQKLEVPAYHYTIKNNIENLDYFSNVNLILKKKDILIPYDVEKKGNKTYTKKLILKELNSELLPSGTSYYKKLFHKGADLNPRNLIFIQIKKRDNSCVEINPDKRIFNRAKKPWDKKEFTNELIEVKYIFKVIKSTELVKFYIYDNYNVFLPLTKEDLNFNYANLSKNAKKFYDKINSIYLKNKKSTTKNKSLMDNLNRWAKLINERQLSNIKVIYNNSGSILNSTVIQGDFLITGDLSFYATDDLQEAHYLTAILNSNLIAKHVRIVKSSRHIFKLPLDVLIKEFDKSNSNHLKLAELGRECCSIAKNITDDFIDINGPRISKIKVQEVLKEKLHPNLLKIDEILKKELF